MAKLDGKISGRVSIGMITSAAQSTLPVSSARIAAQYPDIQLLVCEGYTETMMEWVLSGELDIAIVNTPDRRTVLTAHHILDEEMMLAQRRAAITLVAQAGAVRPAQDPRPRDPVAAPWIAPDSR